MATPDQITAIIRFALSQLPASNRHHEFEHLCRQLARRRICSNILPATGPVAAGGDQGRDFETFRTYLAGQLTDTASFVGLTTDETIVFSCTLQHDDVPGKIRRDIRTITSQGTPVDCVYAFCEANIPTAARHRLQGEVHKDHGIRLEVVDGTALAEMLADAEVFWIAQQYLDLPGEIAPAASAADRPQWYRDGLAKWRDLERPWPTHGEFYDLKRCLRHATFHDEARGDLLMWMGRMQAFESSNAPVSLQRRASYEIVVASLRGLESLDGQEGRIERYFAAIGGLSESSDLEDAQVLLNYLAGAALRNLLPLPAERLVDWRDELDSLIEALLVNEHRPGRSASLLQTLGLLGLLPDVTDPDGPVTDERVRVALERWSRMLDLVPEAPLFPIDRFANIVGIITVLLARQPDYRPFARRLDALVAETAGHSAAAERCRDRAMHLYKAEQYAAALREFHDARHNWFSGDTIRGSLLSSTLIARCYEELGLWMAAKYFCLSAGVLALDLGDPDLHDLAGTTLLAAAQCDYHQGAWFGFLELAEFGLQVHQLLDRDAMDYERHTILQSTLLSLLTCRAVARQNSQAARDAAAATVAVTGVGADVEGVEGDASSWLDEPKEALAGRIAGQLQAVAFADAGDERRVAWRALGVAWTVVFVNTYDATRHAEQFIAAAQIVLADLAGVDLCLLPTEVRIRLSVADAEAAVDAQPSNDGRVWHVTIPRSHVPNTDTVHQAQIETLTALINILGDVSLLPETEFDRRVEELFAAGIVAKTLPAKAYTTAYTYCVPEERFARSRRRHSVPFAPGKTAITLPEHPDLRWYDGPGPGYSRETAEEFLINRYERAGAMTRWTRVMLAANPEFRSTLMKLRAEGWLDWQIVMAVLAAAQQYRVNLGGVPTGATEFERRTKQWAGDEQADWPPIPAGIFMEKTMRLMRQGNMLATLRVWDLDCRQRTPDLPAIERFLVERYGCAEDDIEHEDPFASSVPPENATPILLLGISTSRNGGESRTEADGTTTDLS